MIRNQSSTWISFWIAHECVLAVLLYLFHDWIHKASLLTTSQPPTDFTLNATGDLLMAKICTCMATVFKKAKMFYLSRHPVQILVVVDIHWDMVHLWDPDKPAALQHPVQGDERIQCWVSKSARSHWNNGRADLKTWLNTSLAKPAPGRTSKPWKFHISLWNSGLFHVFCYNTDWCSACFICSQGPSWLESVKWSKGTVLSTEMSAAG